MTGQESQRNPVEQLAEEFLERYRRGERPALTEYTQQHPELADEIRDLFPALALMEEAGPQQPNLGGACDGRMTADGQALDRLGDYRIVREVGRGGMGVVYEAEQQALGRHVALKVLPFDTSRDPVCLERFRREARSAARLHHTNIVPVFDVGEYRGTHYYAMQFIQGQGLDEVLLELRRLRAGKDAVGTKEPAPAGTQQQMPLRHLSASLAHRLRSGQFGAEGTPEGNGQEAEGNPQPAAGVDAVVGAESAKPRDAAPSPDLVRPSPGPVASEPAGSTSAVLKSPSDFSTQSDFHYYRSVARVGVQVAEALAYAHGQKVLHRDIKPANLLLDLQGLVWVTDFGLAKEAGADLTKTGDVVGTLRYMAPERFNGVSDPRGDIYSLGLTLYELLTLRPAFEESDRGRLLKQVTHEEPPRPRKLDQRVPRDLETIVLKAIAKEPGRRYPSAEALAEDLRRFLADRPIRARRTSALEHVWRWCRRNLAVAGLLSLAFGLLLAVTLISTLAASRLQTQQEDLKDQIKQTSSERDRTADAEKQARLDLGKSYLAEGVAIQRSGLSGQQFRSLELLGKAAGVLGKDPDNRKRLSEIRDHALTALGLRDARLLWEREVGDILSIKGDAQLERYAVAERSGVVTIHSFRTGQVLARFAPVRTGFWYLEPSFSPDGKLLCLFYLMHQGPSNCRIVEMDTGRSIFSQEVARACVFLRDGTTLIFPPPSGNLSVWDLKLQREIKQIPVGFFLKCLVLSPDGRQLAVNATDEPHQPPQVKIYDVPTWKELAHWRAQVGHGSLGWSADGRLLAVGGNDGRVHVWDVPRGVCSSTLTVGSSHVTGCQFAGGGYQLITTGWDWITRLWDAASAQLLVQLNGTCYGAAPDGSKLLILTSQIEAWEITPEQPLRTFHPRIFGNRTENIQEQAVVRDAAYSSDGRLLAVAYGEGVRIYDARSDRELAWLDIGECHSLLFDAGDKYLITSGPRGLCRWPLTWPQGPEHSLVRLGPPSWFTGFHVAGRFEPGHSFATTRLPGTHLVAVNDVVNSRVVLQDVERPEDKLGNFALLPCKYRKLTNLSASRDCRWLAGGTSKEPGIQIWDLTTRQLVRDLRPPGPPADRMFCAAFSADGRWLVSTTTQSLMTYHFWRVGSWELAHTIVADRGQVGWHAPVFSPDGKIIALAISARQILLAESATARPLARLSTLDLLTPTPLAFSPDGTRLVASTNQHTLLQWDLRGLRAELAKLELDWDQPPYSAAQKEKVAKQLQVQVDFKPTVSPLVSAQVLYGLALAMNPLNADAAYRRALVHSLQRNWQEAWQDCNRALWLQPEFVPAYYLRGYLAERLGRPREAVEDYLKALSAEQAGPPSLAEINEVLDPERLTALGLNNFAWMRLVLPAQQRAHALALLAADKAVLLGPVQDLYRNTQGVAYPAAGLPTERPSVQYVFWNTQGVAYYRLGMYRQAIVALEHSIRDTGGAVLAFDLYFIALSQHHLGRRNEARASLERADAWVKAQKNMSVEWVTEISAIRKEAEVVALLGLTDPPKPKGEGNRR